MTFTLTVLPNGRAILSTRERLSESEAREIHRVIRGWEEGRGILVIPDCDVVQVTEIELDLPEVPA